MEVVFKQIIKAFVTNKFGDFHKNSNFAEK